jgi:hypothetical protein
MTDDLDPLHGLHPSKEARWIFALLYRRGGSMRLRPLLRTLGMNERAFVEAVADLAERYWIRIAWRKAALEAPDDRPHAVADIERLTTTRFGRRKYRSTWPQD